MKIRAITLWQPFATAIPAGYKHVETRHWSTDYRGPLVIHAATRPLDCELEDFVNKERWKGRMLGTLPFGGLVAICNLTDVLSSEILAPIVDPIERSYGDYSAGRFGWILTNIRPIEYKSIRGGQRFFNVDERFVVPL